MSIGKSLEQRQEFITRFRELAGWSAPNVEEQPPLYVLFDTVDDDSFPGAILPRRINGDTVYYALVESGRDWRSLSPLLKAFVGVTVTDFIGLTSDMSAADPLEAWLSSFGFEAIARFGAEDTLRKRIAEAGLLRLYDCLHLSEVRHRTHPRSTPQVLDDFRMALAAGDLQAAQTNIAFLKVNMRLDALNLCFLEVQLDATFGGWKQLQQRSFFRELCYTRRPPNVTTAMVKALYHTRIEPVELVDGAAAVLAFFRSEIHGKYGELFKICSPSPPPPVAKIFLLTAIAGEDIDWQAVDRLTAIKATWSGDEARSFEHFLTLVEAPDAPTTLEVVKSSWANLLQGLELAENEAKPASIDRAKAVLWSAVEIQTLDAYRTAINYVNRLSATERDTLLATPGYAGIWTNISRHATGKRVPHNWCEWLELLPKMSYAQAQSYAERSTTEWPIARHLQYPRDVEELVDALGNMALTEEDRISTALPNLLLWVQSDKHWPNPDYLPLYEQLLTLFMLTDNRNPNTLQALATLLDGMLLLGMTEAEYTQLMDELGKLTQHLGGTRYVDWLIDVAELTTLYGCPNPSSRTNLLIQIIATISHLASRLSTVQLSILNDLATMLGAPDAFAALRETASETPPPDLAESLRDFHVVIYTLTERVGQRVAHTLTNLYPEIQVDLSHDKASSPRLVELARNADLFVIAWRSAKHAATDAIRQKRSPDRPTIYASGKGSSSILAAIEEHLVGNVN